MSTYKKKARPGVMLYFDILEGLEMLSDEEKGKLFVAILEYGATGVVPDYSESPVINMAWLFIRPKLDRDQEKYNEICETNRLSSQYKTYCYEFIKKPENRGKEPLSIEGWKALSAHPGYSASTN